MISPCSWAPCDGAGLPTAATAGHTGLAAGDDLAGKAGWSASLFLAGDCTSDSAGGGERERERTPTEGERLREGDRRPASGYSRLSSSPSLLLLLLLGDLLGERVVSLG